MLAPLLARSDRWGRIKAKVVCSMSSRYAISLYEAVRLRVNLDRCIESYLKTSSATCRACRLVPM